MKSIAEIDPNFRLPSTIPEGMRFFDVFDPPFSLWGVAKNRRGVLCRLPESFLGECSDGVQRLAYHLAGACVRFSTDADTLAVIWALTETANMPHFAASGQSGLDLFEETDEGTRHVKTLIPAMNEGCGCLTHQSTCFPLPGGMRHYVLYLPLYNGLTELMLGIPEKYPDPSGTHAEDRAAHRLLRILHHPGRMRQQGRVRIHDHPLPKAGCGPAQPRLFRQRTRRGEHGQIHRIPPYAPLCPGL